MICVRCLARAPRGIRPKQLLPTASQSTRQSFVTTSTAHSNNKTSIPYDKIAHAAPQRSPPPATSTGEAQPFSAPETVSSKAAGTPTKPSHAAADATSNPQTNPPQPSKAMLPRSSVPGGTVLKGLNYFKNKPDPVAMDDEEYPDWLWTVLSTEKRSAALGAGIIEQDPRLYSKSDRARRVARKRARTEAKLHPEALQPKTPLFAQAVDLPVDSIPAEEATATGAGAATAATIDNDGHTARLELRQAMRAKRRNDIQENNFLIGLR